MSLEGTWFDRTQEYRARKAGQPQVFRTKEYVRLTPLPALAHLSPREIEAAIGAIVDQIEGETASMHRIQGTKPLGSEWVLRQHPHRVPKNLKRSAARRFLAAYKQSVIELRQAYMDFVQRYREASARLRAGDRMVIFPEGCFPPRLPFVRAGP